MKIQRDGKAPKAFTAGLLHSISYADFDASQLDEDSLPEEQLDALARGRQDARRGL